MYKGLCCSAYPFSHPDLRVLTLWFLCNVKVLQLGLLCNVFSVESIIPSAGSQMLHWMLLDCTGAMAMQALKIWIILNCCGGNHQFESMGFSTQEKMGITRKVSFIFKHVSCNSCAISTTPSHIFSACSTSWCAPAYWIRNVPLPHFLWSIYLIIYSMQIAFVFAGAWDHYGQNILKPWKLQGQKESTHHLTLSHSLLVLPNKKYKKKSCWSFRLEEFLTKFHATDFSYILALGSRDI